MFEEFIVSSQRYTFPTADAAERMGKCPTCEKKNFFRKVNALNRHVLLGTISKKGFRNYTTTT